MSHPVGRGTTNVSVNMPRAEREALGRLACSRDLSISRMIRDLITAALTSEAPEVARRIHDIRVRHRERRLVNQLNFSFA